MIAYRLQPHIDLCEEVYEYLYDVDEDFTSKKEYIREAKRLTNIVNKNFNANYHWKEVFIEPTDIGWRYCKKCEEFYWLDEGCCCE